MAEQINKGIYVLGFLSYYLIQLTSFDLLQGVPCLACGCFLGIFDLPTSDEFELKFPELSRAELKRYWAESSFNFWAETELDFFDI